MSEEEDKTNTVIEVHGSASIGQHSVLGMASATSSSVTSRRSMILTNLFPVKKHGSMANMDSFLMKILTDSVQARTSFINRLQECNTTNVHNFVNHFSNTNLNATAISFATMGPSHFMGDEESREQAIRTVIVSRFLCFGEPNLQPKQGEKWSRKSSSWNKQVKASKLTVEDLTEMCDDPQARFHASNAMKQVRKIVRALIKDPNLKATMPASGNSSFASTLGGRSTDWKQGKDDATAQASNQMPAKRDNPIDNKEIMQMFETTGKILSQLVDTVHGPLSRTTGSRAPELQEIQKKLEDNMQDLARTEPSNMKPKRTQFQNGVKKTHFSIPKSPLDKNYTMGCNDEVYDDMEMNDELNQMVKTNQFWSTLHKQTELDLGRVCTYDVPLKRTPMQTSIFWNGKSKTLEKFIDKFTGHINMQAHMAWILDKRVEKHG